MKVDRTELLARIGGERLQSIARTVLGESGAVLGEWDAVPLKAGGLAALGVERALLLLQGSARVAAEERSWSVVLKVLARGAESDDPSLAGYWKREALLYSSGILDALPKGLGAPRFYGLDEPADGVVWLWQERVREVDEHHWPLARWALAARHLGRFNGAYLAGRPLPTESWLGGRRLRTWLERHHPMVRRIAAAPDNPEISQWWPRPVVDAILRLWQERQMFCDALEQLPQTFGHGDAIRRNLFAGSGPDGSEQTIAIDWEHAGHYAAGEEVGQTLSSASAFYDVEPSDLPALDDALFTGYLAGLADAGWRGDPRPVRFAYLAHAALRNAFNAVGATMANEVGRVSALQTYGHSWEELAERRAVLRPFLLDLAAEARRLSDAR